jgi:uncharacterized protein YbjT (DUF2867 family)
MTSDQRAVYVVGAAGRQGGAAMRQLRARGLEAHALFDERDARGLRDQRWAEPATRLVRFDDAATVERALRGAGALLLVLDQPDTGPAERLRHGRAIADAAVRAGVGHIVFAAATGPDHHRVSCDVSSEIERHLRTLAVRTTVVRPATFMEEIPWYWLSRLGGALNLATPFVGTQRLQLVALEDVGALAALAVARPDEFAGRTIDVAGDVATPLEIATLLADELGEPVRYEEVQVEGVFIYQEASTPVRDGGWLRSVHPALHTLRSWLEEGGGLDLCRAAVERTSGPRAGVAA